MTNALPDELKGYVEDKKEDEPKEHTLTHEKRKERLCEVANRAVALIKWYESLEPAIQKSMGDSVSSGIESLNKILHDYLERKRKRGRPPKDKDAILDETGEIEERKKKGEDRIVSTVDPDARHGAKSDKKHFTGYKSNISMTISGIVTSAEILPGNQNESSQLIPQLNEMAERDIKPPKMITDGLYGTETNRLDAEQRNMTLSSPVREPSNPTGLFDASNFKLDGNLLTCPAGKIGSYIGEQDGRRLYRFDKHDCQACKLKAECTTAKMRTVTFSINHHLIERAIQYQSTEEYKEDKKIRPAIERKNSEVKNRHGLHRARYRTRVRVAIQNFLTFIVVNVKRMVALFEDKICGASTAATGG